MQNPKQRALIVLGFLILVSLILLGCNQALASDEVAQAKWDTSAHADTEAVAFSRWNNDDPPQISERCAKCHSTNGYHDFLGLDGATTGQVDDPVPVGTTVECEACHNQAAGQKDSALMPSGLTVSDLGKNANCMECHQGRQSDHSVREAVAGLEADTVDEELGFLNIHNNAAAATLYGTQAQGGYEYDRQPYVARYGHVVEFNSCITCHDPHDLEVNGGKCSACHVGADTKESRQNIRVSNIDYDGDGDITEGLAGEIETMRANLLLAIRFYALNEEDTVNILYEDKSPYFFAAEGEGYNTWTPRLLQAAYNYHYTNKDSGGFAHNGAYHLQLLYDSLNDLGAHTGGMTRP